MKRQRIKQMIFKSLKQWGQFFSSPVFPEKILSFPEMRVTRKIFTQMVANLFFLSIFRRYSLFFFSFISFFNSCFFCLFVCLLFFEIKNIYSDTHWIMQASEWQTHFHPANFRKQSYFFFVQNLLEEKFIMVTYH